MTEDELFDGLRAYLVRTDAEQAIINPSHDPLEDIVADHQSAPRLKGAHAVINLVGERVLLETLCISYEAMTVGAAPRVIEATARAKEWRFTVDVFASRGLDFAGPMINALQSAHASVDLHPAMVRHVSEPRRVPRMVESQWEGRVQFDVDLAGIVVDRLLIDVIESGTVQFHDAAAERLFATLHFQKG
ncbi:hypothetical protein ABLE91_05785 [Aquabacter sp. CN5-332]|uniref:phage neck terminator protein n=1 Tax=Aquabacter sp. CN5-332 TaxID=3156608 RepID=UPI0032B3D929